MQDLANFCGNIGDGSYKQELEERIALPLQAGAGFCVFEG